MSREQARQDLLGPKHRIMFVTGGVWLIVAAGCAGAAGIGHGASPPISDTPMVTTGTATPHPEKDGPVKTERITHDILEQAGATHVGQALQDVPGIQLRR